MDSSFLLKGSENIVFARTTEEENRIDQGLFFKFYIAHSSRLDTV